VSILIIQFWHLKVNVIILTLSVSFSNSGFFHFGLDSIVSTTNPKITTKTPIEFANRASAGSAVYGSVLLPFLPFLQIHNWLGTDTNNSAVNKTHSE